MADQIAVVAAEEIMYGADDEFIYVATVDLDKHRWYTCQLIVCKDSEGKLWGFDYMDPATEMQEGQDRFEPDSDGMIDIFPVKTIHTISYERV